MHRVVEVRRLDHVVLLVAAQAVLGAERRGERQIAARGQGIERMREVAGHGGRVSEQRDAPAAQRRAQLAFGQQAIQP